MVGAADIPFPVACKRRFLSLLITGLYVAGCTADDASDDGSGTADTAADDGSTGAGEGSTGSGVSTASSSSASSAETGPTSAESGGSVGSAEGGSTDEGSESGSEDSTGGAPEDCGFDPGLAFDPFGEIWQLESANGATCVWLRREDVCPGICLAIPYILHELRVANDGPRATMEPPSTVWNETHHNWNDEAEGWTTDVRFHLNLPFAGGVTPDFSISAVDEANGGTLWGPVQLEPFVPGG